MATIANSSPLAELLRYRHLLASLTWRDVRVRYRQTYLGLSWAVLLPLSMTLVFAFVFTRAVEAPFVFQVRMPYALFAFAGLAPWTFLTSSLSGCINSLVSNRNLVTKVYFPREVFPLSCIGSALVDFGIALFVLAVLMIYYQMSGQWRWTAGWSLLFLPAVVIVQIVLTAGMGLILAMANLFYRDVRQLFSVAIQLWMFVSAVVVPLPSDGGWAARLARWNPLVPLMEAYRDCILRGQWPEMRDFAYCAACASILILVGWRLFQRAAGRFAECI